MSKAKEKVMQTVFKVALLIVCLIVVTAASIVGTVLWYKMCLNVMSWFGVNV